MGSPVGETLGSSLECVKKRDAFVPWFQALQAFFNLTVFLPTQVR